MTGIRAPETLNSRHESARTTGLYDRRNDQVSLDEVEASEEKAAEPAVEDVDVEEGEAEPDDPFIEAEEEDEDDVTNLIDGDIAPDEEP